MSLKMFCVKEAKTGEFQRPFTGTHMQEAIKGAILQLRDPKSIYSQFTEDYSLWFLGEFNQHTGKFEQPEAPVHIGNFTDWVQQAQGRVTEVPPNGAGPVFRQ